MNAKYLVTATIVGGVVLFLWGFITHSLLPQPMNYFKDEMAVVQVLRANAAVTGFISLRVGFLPPSPCCLT